MDILEIRDTEIESNKISTNSTNNNHLLEYVSAAKIVRKLTLT